MYHAGRTKKKNRRASSHPQHTSACSLSELRYAK
jgi:hypothetical protein